MEEKDKHLNIRKLRNCLIASLTCAFSIYWMYICCGEHWRRAIGCQNLILLLFSGIFSFLAIYFEISERRVLYFIFAFISFVPILVVCYLNRYAKYPDFEELISAFNSGHSTDPAVLGYSAIYSRSFQQYSYIIDRSSNSATILLLCLFIWFCLFMIDIVEKLKTSK